MKHKPNTITAGKYGRYLFGRAVYSPGGRFGPRRQQAYQLVVLKEGSLELLINNTIYKLNPGEGILLKPGGLETYSFSTAVSSTHIWCEAAAINFSPEQIQLLDSCYSVHIVVPFVHLLIEQGLKKGRTDEASDCAFSSLAEACLLYDASQQSQVQKQLFVKHPVVRQVMEIVSAEFSSLSSASQLARRIGISVVHMRLLFRQHLRESPNNYLWRVKTERAIQLLRSTGLTINEVADQCGFANAFHLSRRVKAATGASPRYLRQRDWSQGGLSSSSSGL